MNYEELVEILGEDIAKKVNELGELNKKRLTKKKICEILKVLDEEKIDRSILKTNGNILAVGEANKIREVLKLLDKEKIDRSILKTNENILAVGEANKIREVLQALDDINVGKQRIYECGVLLANTNRNNIRNMFEILEKYNLKDIIFKNLNVLKTNYKNAESLIKLFERVDLIEALRNNPSRIYMNGYHFILSRINYLKDKGIELKKINEIGQEVFNPDIFLSSKNFEQKYGIDDKKLKIDYGIEQEERKTDEAKIKMKMCVGKQVSNNEATRKVLEETVQTLESEENQKNINE